MRFGHLRQEPYPRRQRVRRLHNLIYKCRLPCLRHFPQDTDSILSSERSSVLTDLEEEVDENQPNSWASNQQTARVLESLSSEQQQNTSYVLGESARDLSDRSCDNQQTEMQHYREQINPFTYGNIVERHNPLYCQACETTPETSGHIPPSLLNLFHRNCTVSDRNCTVSDCQQAAPAPAPATSAENWYFYDPRLAPTIAVEHSAPDGGTAQNAAIATQAFFLQLRNHHSTNQITAPPTYAQASQQPPNHGPPISYELDWSNGNSQMMMQGPPPCYCLEQRSNSSSIRSSSSDPPTYEQALQHQLLASNLGPSIENYIPRGLGNPNMRSLHTMLSLDLWLDNDEDRPDEDSVDLDLFATQNTSLQRNSEIGFRHEDTLVDNNRDLFVMQTDSSLQRNSDNSTSQEEPAMVANDNDGRGLEAEMLPFASAACVTGLSPQTSAHNTVNEAASWLDDAFQSFQRNQDQSNDIRNQNSLLELFSLNNRLSRDNTHDNDIAVTNDDDDELDHAFSPLSLATDTNSEADDDSFDEPCNDLNLSARPLSLASGSPRLYEDAFMSSSTSNENANISTQLDQANTNLSIEHSTVPSDYHDFLNAAGTLSDVTAAGEVPCESDSALDTPEAASSSTGGVGGCFGGGGRPALRWASSQQWQATGRAQWFVHKLGNA